MADYTGKKIKQLAETSSIADTDELVVENTPASGTPVTKRTKFSVLCNAVKAKLPGWTFTMNTANKTFPGAINEVKATADSAKRTADLVKSNVGDLVNAANIKIVDCGTKVIYFEGYSNAVLFGDARDGSYCVVATNGDWNAAHVNVIGSFYWTPGIHIRLDKAYTGPVRINYVLIKYS